VVSRFLFVCSVCVCVCVCVCVSSDEVVVFPHSSMLPPAGKVGLFNVNMYYNRVMLNVLWVNSSHVG
jgi:hypothetical protein